jgi:AcrR family transcriptional regulator
MLSVGEPSETAIRPARLPSDRLGGDGGFKWPTTWRSEPTWVVANADVPWPDHRCGDQRGIVVDSTEQRITAAAMRLFTAKGGTQVTMSELANEAQVARGTLYRNIGSIEQLFDKVLAEMSAELLERVSATFTEDDDSAVRIATGLRVVVRYGHEDAAAGRFIVRFALTEQALHKILTGPPMRDLRSGLTEGLYDIDESMLMSAAALLYGATVSALLMVLEGHQTWREAGSSASQLVLRALGVNADDALKISTTELRALQPRRTGDQRRGHHIEPH